MRPGVAAPLHAVLLPPDQHQVLPQHLRPARPPLLSSRPAAVPLLRKHRRFSGSMRPSLQICEQLQSRIVHTSLHMSTEGLQRGGGGGGCAWPAMYTQKAWMPGTKRVQSMKSSDMRYSRRVWPFRLGRQMCSWWRWFLHPSARAPCTAPISPSHCAGGPRSKTGAWPGPDAGPSRGVTSRCYPLRLRGEAVATQHGAPARQLLTGGAADGTQVCGRGGGQGRGAGAWE